MHRRTDLIMKTYRNTEGQLHRLDGPAIEWDDGLKQWHLNGQLHRLNGPAVEHQDGTKVWYKYSKLHREDGPAIEHPNGSRFWYIDGVEYSYLEYLVKQYNNV